MKATIYKPAQNAMQTGTGLKDKWVLEFDKKYTDYIDPVMGWPGTYDANRQVNLKFSSRFGAEDYAKRNNIEYVVIEPQKRRVKPKSYASNFN